MLRNTQSSIVFRYNEVRSRTTEEHESIFTIIDFIGNYQNNYLIPICFLLFGDNR